MLFNPDPSKPAQEVLFTKKTKVQNYPTICLNNIQVERASYQKHLGLILDEKPLTSNNILIVLFQKLIKV